MATGYNLQEEELSCPICFEEFDFDPYDTKRHPKLLMCLHTFCYGCIKTLRKPDNTLDCSICRTAHRVYQIADLFDNHVVFEYLRARQELEDEKLACRLKEEFEETDRRNSEQLETDAELARKEVVDIETVWPTSPQEIAPPQIISCIQPDSLNEGISIVEVISPVINVPDDYHIVMAGPVPVIEIPSDDESDAEETSGNGNCSSTNTSDPDWETDESEPEVTFERGSSPEAVCEVNASTAVSDIASVQESREDKETEEAECLRFSDSGDDASSTDTEHEDQPTETRRKKLIHPEYSDGCTSEEDESADIAETSPNTSTHNEHYSSPATPRRHCPRSLSSQSGLRVMPAGHDHEECCVQ